MAQKCFHPSIEGAQHGAKNLADFLEYAKRSGATGAQPSNYMLQGPKGFKTAQEIKDTFEQRGCRWMASRVIVPSGTPPRGLEARRFAHYSGRRGQSLRLKSKVDGELSFQADGFVRELGSKSCRCFGESLWRNWRAVIRGGFGPAQVMT
jgi:hypothetical protein